VPGASITLLEEKFTTVESVLSVECATEPLARRIDRKLRRKLASVRASAIRAAAASNSERFDALVARADRSLAAFGAMIAKLKAPAPHFLWRSASGLPRQDP